MYDISGHPRETVVDAVERDWIHLVDTFTSPTVRATSIIAAGRCSPSGDWGSPIGRQPPRQAAELIDFFKNNPDSRYRVTLLGGVPARWRTLTRDSQTDPRWAGVYRSFDIVSPWTVGRFR